MARRWLSARRLGLKHALQGVKDDDDGDDGVRNAACEVSSDNIPVHHTPEQPESNLRH